MRDLYQQVTDKIVAEIETGALPWLKPWREGVGGVTAPEMPRNADTGRAYSGVNVLILWIEAMSKGYTSGRWLTYKQALAMGGHVRKGETGTGIVFVSKAIKKKQNASDDDESYTFLKSYTVFNVAQCEGLPARATDNKPLAPVADLDAAYTAFIAATGADIRRGGDRAYYSPLVDYIGMPHLQAFRDANNYKATELHELTHWTGHKSRLNRDLNNRFGDAAYAAEELIAEIGAAFLCAELGVVGELRHAGYVANWLKVLKNDKRAIFTAASAASKAAQYLLAFSRSAEGDDVAEVAQAA